MNVDVDVMIAMMVSRKLGDFNRNVYDDKEIATYGT
jgi:hypothetical protein